MAPHLDDVAHQERKGDTDILKHDGTRPSELMSGAPRYILTYKLDASAREGCIAGECSEQCRLASSVGADEAGDLSTLRGHADIVEYFAPLSMDCDM